MGSFCVRGFLVVQSEEARGGAGAGGVGGDGERSGLRNGVESLRYCLRTDFADRDHCFVSPPLTISSILQVLAYIVHAPKFRGFCMYL